MPGKRKWARCNFDGKPIHPDDQKIIDEFRQWLRDDKAEAKSEENELPPEE